MTVPSMANEMGPHLTGMNGQNCQSASLSRRLLAFLCVLLEVIPGRSTCPKSCTCYVPTEVHCTFKYLTTVPGPIQLTVERMNLGYNSLTLLKENDFSEMTRLELLMLHSNMIHQIEDRTFGNLHSLQILKMTYNRVKEINKETFLGLKNLIRLHMDHNRIEFIHPEAFHGMNDLQVVHLEGNLLQQLHADTFVTMRYSQIFKVCFVKTIHLSDNALRTLPPDIFSHCVHLESVYLHGNPWSCDCHMAGLVEWSKKDAGILKCKRDRKYAGGLLCPVCEFPAVSKGRYLAQLPQASLSCSKPWISPYLKKKNITLDEGDYTPVSAKDFIAPIGSLVMNVSDQFQNEASVACTVRRPSVMEVLTVAQDRDVTTLNVTVAMSLVCNIDYEQIQQLWRILATYSDSPMRLERGLLLTKTPDMMYRYTQKNPDGGDDVFTNIEAEIKSNPGWLLQEKMSLQLDRATTTFTTLHIKYLSNVQLREDSQVQRKDRYGWTMVKKDNLTKTEHSVLTGGVADLNCQTYGNPKPSIEWILPDGSKVRAPYNSEDHRIVITESGRLTLRAADMSDTGLYRCIAINYLDADVLSFRITVLPPDVEEEEVNGVQISRTLGDNLLLNCTSAGNPEASVQWILPDHTVLDKSYGNRRLFQNGTLKVQGLTQRDRGFYRCLTSNYIGVDLLVSQITVLDSGPQKTKLTEAEGSGGESDSNYEEPNKPDFNEIPPSLPSFSQESKTITSDRPYPRHNAYQTRVTSDIFQRRRGIASSRRVWGARRIFDKATRKVDPQKWAEIMKKNQGKKTYDEDGENNTGVDKREKSLSNSILVHSENGYAGSGDSSLDITFTTLPSSTVATTQSTDEAMTSDHTKTEVTPIVSPPVVTETKSSSIEHNVATPHRVILHHTLTPNITQIYAFDRNTDRPPALPVTLQMKVTDASSEMQVTFSGDGEETARGVMPLLMTHYTNVTSIVDVLSPKEQPVVHSSTESGGHTTFTAVTTTEQAEGEITFHTTQKIKSPRFPAGSTIISQQQIHIIPASRQRSGRKRNFPGRRRVVRPNRITDIHAYLNKLKKSPVSQISTTVPIVIEHTTDCNCDNSNKDVTSSNRKTTNMKPGMKTRRPSLHNTDAPVTTALKTRDIISATLPTVTVGTSEMHLNVYTMQPPTTESPSKAGSSDFITSADSPVTELMEDVRKQEKTTFKTDWLTTTTKIITTPSKVIRGRIPWQKLFGNKSQKELLSRIRKPIKPTITKEGATVAKTTNTTTPTAVHKVLPTAESLAPPMTNPPQLHRKGFIHPTETSEDSGFSSTPESDIMPKFTKLLSSESPLAITIKTAFSETPTISPSIVLKSHIATTKTMPFSQVLAPLPTVWAAVVKKTFQASSIPGGSSKGLFNRREGLRKFNGGPRRNGFRRRKPSKSSTTSAPHMSMTPQRSPISEATPSVTKVPRIITSKPSKPLNTHLREAEEIKSAVTNRGPYSGEVTSGKHGWKGNSRLENPTSHSRIYTTTMKPKMTTARPRASDKITSNQTTLKPYYTSQLQTTSEMNTIKTNINFKFPKGRKKQYQTQKPSVQIVRPTSSSSYRNSNSGIANGGKMKLPKSTGSFESAQNGDRSKEKNKKKTLTFDTLTIVTAGQDYSDTPAPYSSDIDNSVSTGYDLLHGYDTTTFSMIPVESSTKDASSKPKIVGGNAASYTVLSDSDAFLPCEATGHPEPKISWKRFSSSTGSSTLIVMGKMGKFEVFKNGTLSIQNANIKDRGQYLCLAENSFGSDKLLVTLSVVAYPSRILEPKVREIQSHVGETVQMKCKAEGRPIPLISWILANHTQVRGYNMKHERVTVTSDGTLVIQNVSIYDRGHYKCIASNPAGADTATVRLQVVAAPPGILEEKRQYVTSNTGQSLILHCTAQGSPQPTVHWVLSSGTVIQPLQNLSPDVVMLANGTLLLRSLVISDSGKYECIATSSTGSERRVVTLSVEQANTAPRIMKVSQRWTELSYGQKLLLNCSAVGEPKPRILWRLPSKAVVDHWHRMGNRIQVLDNGTLIIDSLSDKDAGDYLCVARNKIGDDLQLMKVSVSMKPAKIETKLFSKKQVPYGNDLKVDCRATGAPRPEISWGLPDGTVLNSALQADDSGRRTRRFVLFDNGTLYFNRVGMTEEGDYTCFAENSLGKDEMHVHITVVTAAPRIKPLSHMYVKVKPGGNVRFDCEAVGEPKPRILWMLPSNDIIAASNDRYLMHVNGSLDIRNVRLLDVGEYVCMARNTAGDDRKVYKLDIDGNPPIINGYYQNRTVIKDFAAKYSRKFIDCKAVGSPPPQITWIMPDNIFITAPYFGSRVNVHQNGTLEIRNVRATDSAEFICIARNDDGEAVMVVQLEVTSMLKRPIFKNPFNEKVITQTGKTAVLNCSADGQPAPEITWMLPNGTRVTSSPHGAHYQMGNDGIFTIYKPNKEDAGKYRCAAKNTVGYIEKLIVLEVGQKPYILTRPRGVIRSMYGEPLFLHCLADGTPRPQIQWNLPGGHILSRPQVSGRYVLLDNGTLIIRDTTVSDRGNYLCKAKSEVGESALTVPVTVVAYPPRITNGPSHSIRAPAGVPVQLSCTAVGIPKPEIVWELPSHSVLSTSGKGRPTGTELLHPQGTLIIQKPTGSNSGTYKCVAKNKLGVDSRVTYVHVM